MGVRLKTSEQRAVFGKFPGPRGLTPEHFLKVARRHTDNPVEPEALVSTSSEPATRTENGEKEGGKRELRELVVEQEAPRDTGKTEAARV